MNRSLNNINPKEKTMFIFRLVLLLAGMVAGVFVARSLWSRADHSPIDPVSLAAVPPMQEAP